MAETEKNLEEAFAGESQASRRYQYFADKADSEGHPQIARLFRAAVEAETIHARNHLKVLGGINSTQENLKEAISGEEYEYTKMYPTFIKEAKEAGQKRAEMSFNYANAVEKLHHDLYQKALESLEAGQEPKAEPYYVCSVCGNTVAGEAPERCPICGAPRSKFKKVE
ncbi:MAG: rubrerythrin family protein [Dehalococcoidia bacterium]